MPISFFWQKGTIVHLSVREVRAPRKKGVSEKQDLYALEFLYRVWFTTVLLANAQMIFIV